MAEFDPPEALLGDTVFWFPGGSVNEPPEVAVVAAVGHDALALSIFSPYVDRMVLKDGVRHVDDPRAKSVELREAGGWCQRDDYFTRPDVPTAKKAAAGSKMAKKALADLSRQDRKKAEPAGVK